MDGDSTVASKTWFALFNYSIKLLIRAYQANLGLYIILEITELKVLNKRLIHLGLT